MVKKIWKRMLSVTIALLLTASLWLSFQPPVTANVLTDIIKRVTTLIYPSTGRTAPTGRRSGGAGRGPLCPAYLNTAIQSIVPVKLGKKGALQATVPELVWGRTIEAQPTLWFYVPHQAGELKTAKFVLLDADQQLVTPAPILLTLKDTPGIVAAVRLPVALSTNQSYNWFFSIVCSTEKPSRNPGVRGWIERVEPNPELLTALQSTNSALVYRAYAEQGIWYDMVTHLIQQRQNNPADRTLQADWAGLLDILNSPDLQNVPIVRCCEPRSA